MFFNKFHEVVLVLLLLAVQNLTAASVYVAGNFSDPAPSGMTGSMATPIFMTSPGDMVKITGQGFGNRSLIDDTNEMVYVQRPASPAGQYWMIYRGSRDESGIIIHFGLMSWNDTEILMEVPKGYGDQLGSFVQLRRYVDVNDNVGRNSITGSMSLQPTTVPLPPSLALFIGSLPLLFLLRSLRS